jgi:ribonuclease kappa
VLSAWGIIQLLIMGVFFYVRSVALVEDIYLAEEQYTDIRKLNTEMENGYQQNAYNCWIAALLYLVTLCISVQQFWMNNKSTYRV